MKPRTQTLVYHGYDVSVHKTQGQPYLVLVAQKDQVLHVFELETFVAVQTYLEFNWPVGTQVSWKVTP